MCHPAELRTTKPRACEEDARLGTRREQVSHKSLELGQGFFSAVTFGEIQKGVECTREHDPAKASEIETWAARLERSSEVLPMDAACFREYARLMHGASTALAEDAMIAATARVHRLTVATRNERDFARFPVAVFNPFKRQ